MAALNDIFRLKNLESSIYNDSIEVFSIPRTLAQRGFLNITEASINQTMCSVLDTDELGNDKDSKEFLLRFNEKEFRKIIRNWVYKMPQAFSTIAGYSFLDIANIESRYTKTVELLIAFLCINDLKALSASFGVDIDGSPNGGDFDCIANFQNTLYHFEVKSGNIQNVSEKDFENFLLRHEFLSPTASFMFLDYEGRDDKLDSVARKFIGQTVNGFQIPNIKKVYKNNSTNKLYLINNDVILIDLSNKGNVLDNLRFAMQYVHKYDAFTKHSVSQLIKPEHLGYNSKTI